jgi:hypothetical protein
MTPLTVSIPPWLQVEIPQFREFAIANLPFSFLGFSKGNEHIFQSLHNGAPLVLELFNATFH